MKKWSESQGTQPNPTNDLQRVRIKQEAMRSRKGLVQSQSARRNTEELGFYGKEASEADNKQVQTGSESERQRQRKAQTYFLEG